MAAGYVVVTIADNGMIHAYGMGDGEPLSTYNEARILQLKLRRNDRELYPDSTPTKIRVRKIIGDMPPSQSVVNGRRQAQEVE
jgi:hypothetical protein